MLRSIVHRILWVEQNKLLKCCYVLQRGNGKREGWAIIRVEQY
jgi:hypothetical protein